MARIRIHLSVAIVATLTLHSVTATAGSSTNELAADILTGVIPLGAYGLTYFKDDDEGGKQWFYSTATSLALNTALRVAFNQTSWGERPNGHPYGFPSGHMAFVVSGAAFLQDRYGWKYGVPAYLASAYVGWVRVDTHHHRWRDILAAGALSYGVSKLFVTPYEDLQLTPVVGPDQLGLSLQYSW